MMTNTPSKGKLLCLVFLGALAKQVAAQTADEISDWLQLKFVQFHAWDGQPILMNDDRLSYVQGYNTQSRRPHLIWEMKWREIKGFAWSRDDDRSVKLGVSGPSILRRLPDLDSGSDSRTEEANMTINLKPSMPDEEVDRMVKALKQLAELRGATLIDDTLFE